MTSFVANDAPADERRRHQQRVDSLLHELDDRRRRLYLLHARGARPAGLRDLKAELREVRSALAAAVGGTS